MTTALEPGGILILEILDADRDSDTPGPYLPFVLSQLRRQKVKTQWVVLGVPTPDYPDDGSSATNYPLSEPERLAIDRALQTHDPSLVMISRRLTEPTFEALVRRHPSREFAMVTTLWNRKVMLETGGSKTLDQIFSFLEFEKLLHQDCPPDFDREPLNDLAVEIQPYTHLYLGSECLYRRSIGKNRFYVDCNLEESVSSRGCTFCLPPYAVIEDIAEAPVDRALEGILAAGETVPEAFLHHDYQVHGIQLWHELDAFLPRFLALGQPPSSFYFSARFDEILAAEKTLDRYLPDLAEQGHRLLMGNVGLENFSQDENERFNKGLPTSTLDRGIAFVRRIEKAYPDTFIFSALGGFGFIMFTPWTRLEDLEANLAAFRRNALPMEGLHFSSAVQLLPRRAITLLAQRDGLTIEDFSDRRFDSGCMTEWDDYEIPWRFAHPEVQSLFTVSRRVFLDASRAELPLDHQVIAWVQSIGGTGDHADRIFEALIEAARTEPKADVTRLMVVAGALLPKTPTPKQAQPSSSDSPDPGDSPESFDPPPQWRWLVSALTEGLREAFAQGEFSALQVQSCEVIGPDPEWKVRILLAGDARRVCVEVQRHQSGHPAFLKRGQWAVSYHDEEGVAPPLLNRVCQRVLETTGRALATLRPSQ